MPIVKKFDDAEYIEIDQDILCKNLLRKDDLDDSRITIDSVSYTHLTLPTMYTV